MEKQIKAVQTGDTPDMTLTETEQLAIQGIQAQIALVQTQYEQGQQTINERNTRLLRLLEDRLGLPKGSIPKTHTIDFAAMTVIEKPEEPAVTPPATAPETTTTPAQSEPAAD